MRRFFPGPGVRVLAFVLCALSVFSVSAATPRLVQVKLDTASVQQPVSGRLLLFAIPAEAARAAAKDGKVTTVESSPFKPQLASVAAMEVTHLAPGQSVVVDADANAFPAPFSQLPDGDYYVQAVLDANHDYNYGGRGAGDLVSGATLLHFDAGSTKPALSLTTVLPADGDGWDMPADAPQAVRDAAKAARAQATAIDFTSPSLSAFWGRPIQVRGWVLVPPGYAANPDSHYPTVYYTHGFGAGSSTCWGR